MNVGDARGAGESGAVPHLDGGVECVSVASAVFLRMPTLPRHRARVLAGEHNPAEGDEREEPTRILRMVAADSLVREALEVSSDSLATVLRRVEHRERVRTRQLRRATYAACRYLVWHESEYANLLAGLDGPLFRVVRVVLDGEYERLRAGATAEHYANFDLISGLAGLGHFLLRRRSANQEADALLFEVCAYFAVLVRPLEREGHAVPGWWSNRAMNPSVKDSPGHANLSMAHSIPGPLALLAAWRSGVRAEKHADAIETIVDFLTAWSDVDEYGRYWSQALSLHEYTHRPARLNRS